MKQHGDVIRRASDNACDHSGGQPFDLPQVEHVPVQVWQALMALAKGCLHLRRCQLAIDRHWRRDPCAFHVELRLEHVVDRVGVGAHRGAALLEHLVAQDSEQPRADRRPSLETIERLEKGDEHLLRHVFGGIRSQPHSAGSPVETTRMLVDKRGQGRLFTGAEAGKEIWRNGHARGVSDANIDNLTLDARLAEATQYLNDLPDERAGSARRPTGIRSP